MRKAVGRVGGCEGKRQRQDLARVSQAEWARLLGVSISSTLTMQTCTRQCLPRYLYGGKNIAYDVFRADEGVCRGNRTEAGRAMSLEKKREALTHARRVSAIRFHVPKSARVGWEIPGRQDCVCLQRRTLDFTSAQESSPPQLPNVREKSVKLEGKHKTMYQQQIYQVYVPNQKDST